MKRLLLIILLVAGCRGAPSDPPEPEAPWLDVCVAAQERCLDCRDDPRDCNGADACPGLEEGFEAVGASCLAASRDLYECEISSTCDEYLGLADPDPCAVHWSAYAAECLGG